MIEQAALPPRFERASSIDFAPLTLWTNHYAASARQIKRTPFVPLILDPRVRFPLWLPKYG